MSWWWVLLGLIAIFAAFGFRIIRPTERALVETLGKYTRFKSAGLLWIIPLIQRAVQVNITEKMSNIEPQEIITKDNLNAQVDLVVYYKIKSDEINVKKAIYNVDEIEAQLETLARTTARNVIGTLEFKKVNCERNELNKRLQTLLAKETGSWGVEILKVELKQIVPPRDVQETMNQVIKSQNEKEAAVDFATAKETEADGLKRAAIKEAEGIAQGRILVAEANAKKIKIENEAANKYFKGNAQKLKQLEAAQESLKNNAKVIMGADANKILKLFDIGK